MPIPVLDHDTRASKNVGSIDDIPTTAELWLRLIREYREAVREMASDLAESAAA